MNNETKRKLTLEELNYVQKEVKAKGKNVVVAYILLVFLGSIGLHLGYLEKTKLAIARALLTVSTIISFLFVEFASISLIGKDVTMSVQQSSSIIAVAFFVVLLIQFSWFIYDLIAIPKLVRKVNEEIEQTSSNSVIQSRYAIEMLRKNEVSRTLIRDMTEFVVPKVEEELRRKTESIEIEIESSTDKIESLNESIEKAKLDTKALLELSLEEIKRLEDKISLQEVKINELASQPIPPSSEISILKTEKDEIEIVLVDNKESTSDEKNLDEPVALQKTEDSLAKTEDSSTEVLDGEKVSNVDKDSESKQETEDTPLTVESALLIRNKNVEVEGYIIGQMTSDGEIVNSKFKSDSNIIIADNKGESDIKNMLIIQMGKRSELRKLFGLNKNPGKLGSKVLINGVRGVYFSEEGLKKVTKIEQKS